jgi:Family of unknown function (DUF5372)
LGSVTITHPHHPLFGQCVEIVRLRRGEDPDLIVRLPDGTHAAIALSLTDASGPPAETTTPDPLPLLAIEGLRQAAELIAAWREGVHGAFPTTHVSGKRSKSGQGANLGGLP